MWQRVKGGHVCEQLAYCLRSLPGSVPVRSRTQDLSVTTHQSGP